VPKQYTFLRDEVFPSWWPNAISEQVGVIVENFELRKASITSVEVPADSANGLAVVGINGRWRFRSTPAVRSHPGGAAGTYPVFAVAAETDIGSAPLPYTDETAYAWDLRIEPPGGEPALSAGVVDHFRKVGEVDWSGSQITAVRQLVGQVSTRPAEPTARRTDEVPLRVRGAAGQTADLLRVEDAAGSPFFTVPPVGGAMFRAPATGEALGLYTPGAAYPRARFISNPLSSVELGDGSGVPDVALRRAGPGSGALVGSSLTLWSNNMGFYGAAPVPRYTGWGTFLHSDGTPAITRQQIVAGYTTDHLVDILWTMREALISVGLWGL
jgi:hypothetical protein